MTERMNPPALGIRLIDSLERLKIDLSSRLRNKLDDSPIWNESVWSFAIEFYELFHEHYTKYPDFADQAVDAATQNAVASAIEVLSKQSYNYISMRPAYKQRILEAVTDHIRREAERSKPQLLSPIIAPPSNSQGFFAQAIPTLRLLARNPVAERRKEFVEPLLEERVWTIDDWAKHAGVSHHTASDYLHGKRKTHRYNLLKLAKALGVSYLQFPK